jgi:hypothetical protein
MQVEDPVDSGGAEERRVRCMWKYARACPGVGRGRSERLPEPGRQASLQMMSRW